MICTSSIQDNFRKISIYHGTYIYFQKIGSKGIFCGMVTLQCRGWGGGGVGGGNLLGGVEMLAILFVLLPQFCASGDPYPGILGYDQYKD